MQITLNKKDIIWSYIGTAISMGGSFLMLPFLIRYLDGDMLGLWYVFSSIGAIAILFDFGFSPAIARNIAYCWSGAQELKREGAVFIKEQKEPNWPLMKRTLLMCQRIYLILSLATLILSVTVGSLYIGYITKHIEGFSYWIAWAVYCSAIFLNLYYGYYASFLRGVGAIADVNKLTVVARGLQILLTAILQMCGAGIIGACIAYLAYGICFRLLGRWRFYKYCAIGQQLKLVSNTADSAGLRELFDVVWHNAWRDGVVSLANYMSNQASTIICSLYLSLAETGIYSLAVQLTTAVATIAATLYTSYQPSLQAAYVNHDIERQRCIMSLIVVAYIAIFIVGMLALITVGVPILNWIKPGTTVSIPILVVISMYQFILKYRNCYASYFSCTNRIPYVKAFLVSAGVCIALSLIFTGMLSYGMWGLITAQIVSQLIYNAWAWPLKTHRELSLPLSTMLKLGRQELLKMFQISKGNLL